MHVSYEVAQQIVDKAVEKSKQMGVKMCIAILDSGGNLKSLPAWMMHGWAVLISQLKKQKQPVILPCPQVKSANFHYLANHFTVLSILTMA